jgi:hypothetical protein
MSGISPPFIFTLIISFEGAHDVWFACPLTGTPGQETERQIILNTTVQKYEYYVNH